MGTSQKLRIGILALQGAIAEHETALRGIEGVEPVLVRYPHELENLAGIILPGGESTAMGKLLYKHGLMEPLKKAIAEGLSVYGTCAGMILLAKDLVGDEEPHLALMDIRVRRNAYGGQLDSFIAKHMLEGMTKRPFPMVFIRAPWIEALLESDDSDLTSSTFRQVWAYDGRVVAARQGHMLVTSFHPELTAYDDIHRYFVNEVIGGATGGQSF